MWAPPIRPDELYHWGTNRKHRYIAKIGEGKDARYFYSQAELDAYKKEVHRESDVEKESREARTAKRQAGYQGLGKEMKDIDSTHASDNSEKAKQARYHAWTERTRMDMYRKSLADHIRSNREKKARDKYGHTEEEMNRISDSRNLGSMDRPSSREKKIDGSSVVKKRESTGGKPLNNNDSRPKLSKSSRNSVIKETGRKVLNKLSKTKTKGLKQARKTAQKAKKAIMNFIDPPIQVEHDVTIGRHTKSTHKF